MSEDKEADFNPLDIKKTIPMRNIGSDKEPHYVYVREKIINGIPELKEPIKGVTSDEVPPGGLAQTAEHLTITGSGEAIDSKGNKVRIIGGPYPRIKSR